MKREKRKSGQDDDGKRNRGKQFQKNFFLFQKINAESREEECHENAAIVIPTEEHKNDNVDKQSEQENPTEIEQRVFTVPHPFAQKKSKKRKSEPSDDSEDEIPRRRLRKKIESSDVIDQHQSHRDNFQMKGGQNAILAHELGSAAEINVRMTEIALLKTWAVIEVARDSLRS